MTRKKKTKVLDGLVDVNASLMVGIGNPNHKGHTISRVSHLTNIAWDSCRKYLECLVFLGLATKTKEGRYMKFNPDRDSCDLCFLNDILSHNFTIKEIK